MKTKSILILLSAVFFSLILTACGSLRDPNDYENETCVVCGKKAKHKVVWGIQY